MAPPRTLEPIILNALKLHGEQTIYGLGLILLPNETKEKASSMFRTAINRMVHEGKVEYSIVPRGNIVNRKVYKAVV